MRAMAAAIALLLLSPPALAAGASPEVSVAVRAALVAGRPVPYRLTLRNVTNDVIVPILAEATVGKGTAEFARPLVGDIRYDEATDRFTENPLAPRPKSAPVLHRSALMPGEALVQDIDVRYPKAGDEHESIRVTFHRLSIASFDSHAYVRAGGRRYAPIGLITDKTAREGALLAGFYVNAEKAPSEAAGAVDVDVPPIGPSIAARITAAGFDPGFAIAAPWAAGWIAGDAERSVLVTPESTKPLPGVSFEVVKLIDSVDGQVPFCVTGARREEIAPLFPGAEIVPHECLHVSVAREAILKTLERIASSPLSVKITTDPGGAPGSRELLDLLPKPRGVAALPAPTATAPRAKPKPKAAETAAPAPTEAPR